MPPRPDPNLADVFVERTVNGPLSKNDICLATDDMVGCFDLYKVEWLESLIGIEDERLICHFRAPDAESVRVALRNSGTEFDALWAGTLHGPEEPGGSNVIIEYRFGNPGPRDTEEVLRTVNQECLAPHRFKLNRTIISRDRTRAICLCEAQSEVVPRHGRVWQFLHVAAQS